MNQSLPQDLKTELARILIFSHQYSQQHVAYKLRFMANRVQNLASTADIKSTEINPRLFGEMQDFWDGCLRGDYDHPFDLAGGLELLANRAWDEVDNLYQSMIQIP